MDQQKKLKIVVLSSGYSHSQITINSLKKKASVYTIEIEDDYGRMNRNRYRNHGFIKGFGQKLFIKFAKWQKRLSKKRIQEIIERFNMDVTANSPDRIISDIQDDRLSLMINSQQPDLIVLNCASIIPTKLLHAVNAPFINIHGGITPLYRGIFGAYWALRDGNDHLIGSTIHKVDEGLDTGEILKQVFFFVNVEDNFSTYNYLSLAHSLKGLHEILDYYQRHGLLPEPVETDLDSKVHSHPTLFGYVLYRLIKGVK